MSSVISGNFLSSVGRRKTKVRLQTMTPIIPINRSKGVIKRNSLQKCLDCSQAEVKTLFRKSWQDANKKYIHNSGCISERKF